MGVPQILVLFFFVWSLIEFIKKSFVKKALKWENIVAFALGGAMTLIWEIGLLSLGGIPTPENVIVAGIVNFLLMGIATAEGASWLEEYISLARQEE